MEPQLLTPQHIENANGALAANGCTAPPNPNQNTTYGIQNTQTVAEEDNSNNNGVYAGTCSSLYTALPPLNRLIGCGG